MSAFTYFLNSKFTSNILFMFSAICCIKSQYSFVSYIVLLTILKWQSWQSMQLSLYSVLWVNLKGCTWCRVSWLRGYLRWQSQHILPKSDIKSDLTLFQFASLFFFFIAVNLRMKHNSVDGSDNDITPILKLEVFGDTSKRFEMFLIYRFCYCEKDFFHYDCPSIKANDCLFAFVYIIA